ncbi:MAG: gamma-glutamyltransferase [bacterium]|nr:gamma-glutamyltransferase [bacterium]
MHRLMIIALCCTAVTVGAYDRPEGGSFASRSVVYGENGMVAAAHPMAVQIGLAVLKDGGSAVDAAIAMNAALGFMEPVSCGLGGDLFALVWDPSGEGELHGLNASGRSPAALTIDKVPATDGGLIPRYSPYAWSIPGCASGWFALHEKFGELPMNRLLQPTIDAATNGTPVPQVIAGSWARSVSRFGDKPGFAEVFMPDGKTPAAGEVFKNPALAESLKMLAEGGYDAYYKGPIAEAIVAFSEKHGGFFSLEDFAEHRADWVEPISTTYRGRTVWELPPNGQGLAALQMLNILEGYDIAAMGRDSVDFWHLLIEAKKLAYEDRAKFYADMDFAKLPIEGLLDKGYAKERAKLIDMNKAARRLEPGNPNLRHGDTTFLVAADKNGMMVSLIQSNYTGFGSGYVVPELGFGIQNRGSLFSLDPDHLNALEPKKRPFHTIIPAFFGDADTPTMAFGVMGGDMQPQGHVQIVLNIVDFGMNLQEAGDAARMHHSGMTEPTGKVYPDGGIVHLESGIPVDIRHELLRRGHILSESTGGLYGGYQAIHLNTKTGVYAGATESRKDGNAAGY